MTMLPFRVFVSSTFVDLKDHRASVRDGIRELGAVDVAMEHLGARDERPKAECVRMVRDESDFFVGIYAHRYGSIPPGDDVSVTETEYQAASATGLPCLIYLVNETEPWSPPLIEQGEGAAKLARLKKHLQATHICKYFAKADELRAFVCADLGREFLRKVLPRVSPDGASSVAGPELAPRKIEEWNKQRYGVYEKHRDVFLVHTIAPSKVPGQKYDIAIYLARHHSADLSHVKEAQFFLGPAWKNRVFTVRNEGGPMGILTSAFGTFLCYCAITFTDGKRAVTSRYIDFESGDGRDAVAGRLPRQPISSQPPEDVYTHACSRRVRCPRSVVLRSCARAARLKRQAVGRPNHDWSRDTLRAE